jgi:hypothetical protein
MFYVNYLIEKNRIHEVPVIMKNKWSIQDLMPERDKFHFSEVITFYQILMSYFIFSGDIIKAQVLYDMLFENGFKDFIADTLLMDLTLKINKKIIEQI